MRYLAIDLGDKRTGLATGDDGLWIASPAGVIEISIDEQGGNRLLDAIAKEAASVFGPPSAPGAIVLGLPLNMDDSEGPRAKLAIAFAERIAEATGRTVYLQDERQTSIRANALMAQTGLTHKQKKKRRDAIAAAAILDLFFDALDTTTDDASSE